MPAPVEPIPDYAFTAPGTASRGDLASACKRIGPGTVSPVHCGWFEVRTAARVDPSLKRPAMRPVRNPGEAGCLPLPLTLFTRIAGVGLRAAGRHPVSFRRTAKMRRDGAHSRRTLAAYITQREPAREERFSSSSTPQRQPRLLTKPARFLELRRLSMLTSSYVVSTCSAFLLTAKSRNGTSGAPSIVATSILRLGNARTTPNFNHRLVSWHRAKPVDRNRRRRSRKLICRQRAL